MAKHHKVSHPVKLSAPGGKTGLGRLWNATPAAGVKQASVTVNKTRTPVRGGMGATRSREWYARYD